MAKNNYLVPFIIFLVISAFLGLIVVWQVVKTTVEVETTVEDKAILDVQIYQWAINYYDETEMFFEYWIYNYGNAEAKNVKVKCYIYDQNHNSVKSVTDNFGNVASYSGDFGDAYTNNVMKETEEYGALCYVESCDNCEILYKRIPDLVESYETASSLNQLK